MPEGTFCESVGRVWSSFTLPLWSSCVSLMFFTDHLISSLLSSHLQNICGNLLLEYAYMPMDAAQMEISSSDCTPTFIFPTFSYTHTNFLPIPRMHMPFHTAFLLQTLFPLPGMTFSSRRTPSSFMTGSFSLNTLVRHLCSPSRGCYAIVSLSVPCLMSAPRTPKF